MFKRLVNFFSSISGLALACLALTNFYLSFKAASVSRRVYCLTNFVEVASIPSNAVDRLSFLHSPTNIIPFSSGGSSNDDVYVPREVAVYPYQYFVIGRRIGAYMFGRYYYDGSSCSWGRIATVWPDRILLEGGDWITNASNNETRKPERIAQNDHR